MHVGVFGIGPLELVILAAIGTLVVAPLVILAIVLGSGSGGRTPPAPPGPPPAPPPSRR